MVAQKRRRRGLVLEGGGAKGAWQFGVLQALAENGIEFDVVSGTSVGALNAAIWCAGRMDVGKEMWGSMSFPRVFALKLWLIPIVLVGLPSRIFYAFFQGYAPRDTKSDHILYVLSWLMMAVAPIVGGWAILSSLDIFEPEALFLGVSKHYWLITGFIMVGLFFVGYPILVDAATRRNMFVNFGLVSWGMALFATQILFGTPHWGIIWFGAAPVILLMVAWLLRSANISMFVPQPLERTIRTVLSGTLRVPIFATAAAEVGQYYDPDNLHYEPVRGFARDSDIMYYSVVSLAALVPSYVRVDLLDADLARDALLASSALPLGVVPARRDRDGRRLIDGGVADNVPWFPLVSDFPCDELVIVHCNPTIGWNDESARRLWEKTDRLRRVVETKFVAMDSMHDASVSRIPPTAVPLREPQSWPSKTVVIAPDQVLGSFRTGTMGFSQKRCEKRMKDGYAVGIRKISEILGPVEAGSSGQ